MKIESVIFDCDGVIIDSEFLANRTEVALKAELGFPISLEDQLSRFVGLAEDHPSVLADLAMLPCIIENFGRES